MAPSLGFSLLSQGCAPAEPAGPRPDAGGAAPPAGALAARAIAAASWMGAQLSTSAWLMYLCEMRSARQSVSAGSDGAIAWLAAACAALALLLALTLGAPPSLAPVRPALAGCTVAAGCVAAVGVRWAYAWSLKTYSAMQLLYYDRYPYLDSLALQTVSAAFTALFVGASWARLLARGVARPTAGAPYRQARQTI